MVRPLSPPELARMVEIDDAASVLYERAGLDLVFGPDHPFVLNELERWRLALDRGTAWGVDVDGALQGFAVLGACDGHAYLDQISVHPDFMRRGLGRALLERVIGRAHPPLWLTTYGHLPWNRPYYERFGFVVSDQFGPELRALIDEQRASLPAADQRVAMVR